MFLEISQNLQENTVPKSTSKNNTFAYRTHSMAALEMKIIQMAYLKVQINDAIFVKFMLMNVLLSRFAMV